VAALKGAKKQFWEWQEGLMEGKAEVKYGKRPRRLHDHLSQTPQPVRWEAEHTAGDAAERVAVLPPVRDPRSLGTGGGGAGAEARARRAREGKEGGQVRRSSPLPVPSYSPSVPRSLVLPLSLFLSTSRPLALSSVAGSIRGVGGQGAVGRRQR
jgi:hypothetical protein